MTKAKRVQQSRQHLMTAWMQKNPAQQVALCHREANPHNLVVVHVQTSAIPGGEFRQQVEETLRVMQQNKIVLDYGTVRTKWDGEVSFHEVDVYIPEEFWLDDGDVQVTEQLLQLQTERDLLSPYVHPAPINAKTERAS